MKTYFQILSYARPFSRFAIPYVLFALLASVFATLNFMLIIPLLEVLFNSSSPEEVNKILANKPAFSWDLVTHLKDLIKYYVVLIRTNSGPFRALQVACGVIVASVLLSNVFRYLAQRTIEFFRVEMIYRLRKVTYEKMIALHIGYFSNEKRGDIISRLTSDIIQVEDVLTITLTAWLKEPLNLIILFSVLFGLSAKLTLFTLIVIPVSGGMIALVVRKIKEDAKEGQKSLGSLLSLIDESLGGLRIINAFNAFSYIRRKFDLENRHYRNTILSLSYRRELAAPFSEFTGVLIVVGIVWFGGSLVLQKQSQLSPSEFIAYIALFSQVIRPIKDLSGTFGGIQRGLAAGERILQLVNAQPAITSKAQAPQLTTLTRGVEFVNVSFAYEEKQVLKGVSFAIQKGQTVALVGPSGGGKSTIADLVPRFYDVTAGSIQVDGVDIREYSLDSLRAQMGIVTQEAILFNDSIFNNIAFGTPDASREEVIRAAKVANAHEFIMATENGYDTVIGDRGMKLSGGQRQRLSIARAVFKNPPILILDEATSALDTESEKLVQEALTNLMKNRTTLVIAHRLSTIQHADEILVIQQGEIVERGTHLDLIHNEKGLYRRLNLMQTT